MPKTVPTLPSEPPSNLPFSKVVEANGFVFLAGQIGDAPGSAGPVPGGIEAETRAMLDNVGRLLRAVGLDYGDVVRCTVYLTDFDDFAAMNAIYREVFPAADADPGDGPGDAAGARRPDRDRGDRRSLRADGSRPGARTARRPPRLRRGGRRHAWGLGQVPTISSSIATGRPLLETAMRMVCCPPEGRAREKSKVLAWNVDRRRLTAATKRPST